MFVHKSIPSKTRTQHTLLCTFFCSLLPPSHSSFLNLLRACLSLPGYSHLRSYVPKLFPLTGVEALRNGHMIRSQGLRRKKIISFSKHLEIPGIKETATFQSWGHPVHSDGYFLACRISFWLGLSEKFSLSRLTWHWFNLNSAAQPLLSHSTSFSESMCYSSAFLANAFSKNVPSKTRILIIHSVADGLVPPAPLSSFPK